MKRIIALLISAVIIAATASGCMGMGAPSVEQYPTDASTETKDYNNTYEDLCKYLSAKGYINALESNKGKSYAEMNYKLIGAAAGNKFNCVMSGANNVTIELYDFTKPASPDEVYNSVKKDGTFSVYGLEESRAYLSDNGNYMMIYNDSSIDWKNPDEKSNEYKRFEEIYKEFKGFKK